MLISAVAWAQGPVPAPYDFASLVAHRGVLWSIFVAFVGGVLVSLTPCVYPMIPITVGIIATRGGTPSLRRSFGLAFTYVFGLVVVYSILGLLAGLLGAQVRGVVMSPAVLIAVSLVFVALALGMFGVYELQVPASVATKLGSIGGRGFMGVLLMGMISGLVASPCTAAPLAGILTFVAVEGSPVIGFLLLFAFAWGMGLLLIVVGTFSGALARLPRSGVWMLDVKRLFGFVFLAVAAYFVRILMPAMVYHIIIALCLIGAGIAFGALDSIPQPSTGQRIKKGLAFLTMVLGFYVLLGTLWAKRIWLPEQPAVSVATKVSTENVPLAEAKPLEWTTDVYTAFEKARQESRHVLMDWSAEWCDECKKMEREAFSRPDIREAMERYVLLRVDVTELDTREEKLAQKYKFFAPPTLIVADGDGNQIGKLEGYDNPDTVLAFLKEPKVPAEDETASAPT